MYDMPELVVMSTDSPLPPPVSNTVDMSPAADVESAYESLYDSAVYDLRHNVGCNLIFC
jgi:hypothetical protein